MKPISVTFEQVASALEAKAATRETISYNDFADLVGLPRPYNFFANSAMKAYFEQIDYNDAEESRPFRTALVVAKKTGRPSKGFFASLELLRGMKIPSESEASVWDNEIAELYDYYTPNQPRNTLKIALSRAQNTRLARLCKTTGQSPEALIEACLTRTLSSLEEEVDGIKEAEAQIERGELYTHDEVRTHLIQLLDERRPTPIMQLDHITVYVVDMARSAHFYETVLGLESIPEPFQDGLHLWYSVGPGLSLHVIGGATPIPTPPISHHFAFRVPSLDPVMQRLDQHHVIYRNFNGDARINIRPDGLRQIYLQDPDGYWIEINEAG